MARFFQYVTALFSFAIFSLSLSAQSVDPTASYIDENGDSITMSQGESYSGSAPLTVHFAANPEDADDYTTHYEWRFYSESDSSSPLYIRYDESTDFTFKEAGTFNVYLVAQFVDANNDTISWSESDIQPFTISISESELNMPNAFSPNGDGINDIYKPKSGYTSIVSFHAYIFNRWGVKLYEWTDPSTGWDGTYKGKDVKDGVYFCLVEAKGADGRTFSIKTDVNVLRGYTESTSVSE